MPRCPCYNDTLRRVDNPMDPATLLEQLAPLREPAPITWWPPAPGWWLLGVLMMALLLWGAYWLAARYARNRYRRQALKVVDRMKTEGTFSIEQLSALLKATALQTWPTGAVAALHGDSWLNLLQTSYPAADPDWTLPLKSLYTGTAAPPSDDLLQSARDWIRRHQIPSGATQHD